MTARTRRQQIEEMLAEEPNDPELRYMLGMEYVSAGDDEAAARVFEDLIAVVPKYPPGYHQLGRTLVRLNRIDAARGVLQRGIPVAAQLGDAHTAGEMQGLLESLE